MKMAFQLLAGLAVLLASLSHVPAQFESLDYFEWPKRAVWALLMAGVFGLSLFRQENRAQDKSTARLEWVILALMGWMVLRSVIRHDPWVELGTLAIWLLPPLAFCAGLRIGRPTRPFIFAVLVAALIQIAIMLLQFSGHDPLFNATTSLLNKSSWRMIGTIGYQNQAAAFVAVATGFAALWIRNVPCSLALSALALAAISMTGCRSVTVATILATAGAWWLRWRTSGRRTTSKWLGFGLLVAGVVAAAILVLANPTFRDRALALTRPQEPAAGLGSRLRMATIACDMWRERPLIGWGTGAFPHQYLARLGASLPEQKTPAMIDHLVYARHAHNDYLQFGAEFGWIGWGILAFGLVDLLRRFRQAPVLFPTDREALRLSICAAFVLVYGALDSLVSFPWQMASVGPLVGLLMGMAAAPPNSSSAEYMNRPESAWANAILFAGAAGTLFLALEFVRLDIRVRQCETSPDALDLARRLQATRPWTHREQAVLGARLAANEEHAAAIAVLSQAKTGYSDVALFNNLGHALARSGQWDQAAEIYGEWVKTGLDHPKALDNWIAALSQSGRFPEALEATEQLMRFWGKNNPRFNTLPFNEKYVFLLLENGQIDQAHARLQRLLEQHGEHEVTPLLSNLWTRCQQTIP